MSKLNENRPGYRKTKIGWIPEEWADARLSSIVNGLQAGVSVNSHDEKTREGELGVLKTSAVTYGYFCPEENKRIVDGEIKRARVSPTADSIIISRMNTRALVGANVYIGKDFPNLKLPDRLWQMLIKNKKKYSPRWLGYLMASSWLRSVLSSRATGTSGSMKNISKQDVLSIKIPLPPLPEQKKIAEILSTWDRAIDQVGKFIDAKQRLKKGLMQQLLSGRMRFPEFDKSVKKKGQLPEGWEIKPLGSFGLFSKGKGISNNLKRETGFPCITYGEIYGKHEIVIQEFCSYIDGDTAHNSQLISKGDILFAGSGETLNEIGKCVAFTKDVEAYAGGDIVIFHPESVCSLYLSYSLNSDLLIRQKRKLGQGHSVVHIYSAGLKTLQVPLPSFEEQTRIASILSVCDREIQLLVRKRDILQEQKKGLMQKLLTGELRARVRR